MGNRWLRRAVPVLPMRVLSGCLRNEFEHLHGEWLVFTSCDAILRNGVGVAVVAVAVLVELVVRVVQFGRLHGEHSQI